MMVTGLAVGSDVNEAHHTPATAARRPTTWRPVQAGRRGGVVRTDALQYMPPLSLDSRIDAWRNATWRAHDNLPSASLLNPMVSADVASDLVRLYDWLSATRQVAAFRRAR